jgi:hypothetical protein
LALSLTRRMRALAPRYRKAQRESQALYRIWSEAGTDERLLHPIWKEARQVFAELITGGLPPNFLTLPFVRHMLYRTGFGELEKAEVGYLKAAEPWIRDLCLSYREPRIGEPVFDCPPTGLRPEQALLLRANRGDGASSRAPDCDGFRWRLWPHVPHV